MARKRRSGKGRKGGWGRERMKIWQGKNGGKRLREKGKKGNLGGDEEKVEWERGGREARERERARMC